RFRWVPFADALMYPLDTRQLAVNSDRKSFFEYERRLFERYLKDSGFHAVPETLDDYLQRVVTPTLERQKQGGAVAVKFEAAYLRPLDFNAISKAHAEGIFQRFLGAAPTVGDYKLLQDFLFRYIAAECGRLQLPVHIHVMAGAGSYFHV